LKSRLIVELDGEIHFAHRDSDKERDQKLQVLGFKVIRFENAEIFENMEKVLKKILVTLESPSPPSPLPQAGEGWQPLG
jgi:very-short-patch-repair endonuclease